MDEAPWPREPYGTKAQRMLARGRELTDAATTDAWWAPNGVTKDGITCWVPRDGTPGARGDGVLPYPLHAILETLNDVTLRPQYDERFVRGTFAEEEIDETQHSRLLHLLFSGVFVVAPRDFATLTHWRMDPRDGSVFLLASSLDEPVPELLPATSSTVRAHLELGGWLVRPIGSADEAESCHVTTFMRTDLKGLIPSRLIAIVLAQQAGIVKLVGDVLRKKYGAASASEIRDRMGPLRNVRGGAMTASK